MKSVKVIKCKAKDLLRELAIEQLKEVKMNDIKKIGEILQIIKL